MLLPWYTAEIPCMIPVVKTPSPLPLSCIQYSGWDPHFSDTPPQEMELGPSKPPLPFCQVGYHQHFHVQCVRACPPAYILPPSSSSRISASVLIPRLPCHFDYFFVPVVLSIWHISDDAVSTASSLRRHPRCHMYPLYLSYSVSDYAVLVNLCFPLFSRPSLSPPSHISVSTILVVLRLFRISFVVVSVVPCLCRCRNHLLCPRSVPPSHYY